MIRENFEDLAKLLALMADKKYIDACGVFTEEGKSYVRRYRGSAYVDFVDERYLDLSDPRPGEILEQLKRLEGKDDSPRFWLCEDMHDRRSPSFHWHWLKAQEDCRQHIRRTAQYFDLVREFDSMSISPRWDEINDMDIL